MSWVRDWFARLQRAIDLRLLWPACKSQARDMEHAKAAFAYHAFHDRAWRNLGHDQIIRIIEGLS